MKTEETLKQLEERLGITEIIKDYPLNKWVGDDCPTSDYYCDEEPNYEASHKRASKALARLDRFLATKQ